MLDRPAGPGPAVGAVTPVDATPFYLNLEALRGICAMLVVMCHIEFTSPLTQNFVVRHGWLFVDFFFVLSGFVIALIHMRAPTGTAAARRFLIRRFYRIYPLHVATTAAVVLLFAGWLTLYPHKSASIGVDDNFGWVPPWQYSAHPRLDPLVHERL